MRPSTIIVWLLLLSFGLPALATQRALIIGINKYEPPKGKYSSIGSRGWVDLDGTINDAVSMKETVMKKYGFQEKNIHFLIDESETTREGLIRAFNTLVQETQSGDIVLIYYAGHGSQVMNSLSPEFDRLDESIVPSDSYTGVPDIRDKELNQIFSRLVNKGAKLTVIFDSCNSGSATRSDVNLNAPKVRAIRPVREDIRDSYTSNYKELVDKGMLFISAAQDYQLAREYTDSKGIKHGAFTFCLVRAMMSSSPNESAINIFRKAKSIMLYNAIPRQNPVIEGIGDRKEKPLLGTKVNESQAGKVAVFKKQGNRIMLDGGFVSGLKPGAELKKVGEDGGVIRLKVISAPNIDQSIAEVIEGDIEQVSIGQLYLLEGWASDSDPSLQVWIPQDDFSEDVLADTYQQINTVCQSRNIELIKDPREVRPTHVMLFSEGKWSIRGSCGSITNLPKRFTEGEFSDAWQQLEDQEATCSEEGSRLFVFLPAHSNLKKRLQKTLSSPLSTIQPVNAPTQAQYLLAGQYNSTGNLEYTWVQAIANEDSPYPLRTNWIQNMTDADITFSGMYSEVEKLSRIKGWFTLASPPNDESFPYTLALKNANTGKIVEGGDDIRNGERYGFVLQKDELLFENWRRKHRFLYVFGIDSYGNLQLFYPFQGSIENNTKTVVYQNKKYLDEAPLGPPAMFEVGPPFGIDSYFLLSCATPLDDPELLEDFRKLRSATSENALMSLFQSVVQGESKKVASIITPTSWMLQRISINSKP